MNSACIVVSIIALGAGGVAAYPASGPDTKSLRAEPVAHVQTVDALVAKSDTSLGRQTWSAATASNTLVRRNERLGATTQIAGSIARTPLIAGEPIREPKPVKANGAGFTVENQSDEQAPKRAIASAWFATAS